MEATLGSPRRRSGNSKRWAILGWQISPRSVSLRTNWTRVAWLLLWAFVGGTLGGKAKKAAPIVYAGTVGGLIAGSLLADGAVRLPTGTVFDRMRPGLPTGPRTGGFVAPEDNRPTPEVDVAQVLDAVTHGAGQTGWQRIDLQDRTLRQPFATSGPVAGESLPGELHGLVNGAQPVPEGPVSQAIRARPSHALNLSRRLPSGKLEGQILTLSKPIARSAIRIWQAGGWQGFEDLPPEMIDERG